MKERPILFSAPMVRAILDGRKTQTRRWLHASPGTEAILDEYDSGWSSKFDAHGDGHGGLFRHVNGGTLSVPLRCPYGSPEERLWVRETFTHITGNGIRVHYRADGEPTDREGRVLPTEPGLPRWRPSIFMRRSESRITLEIAEVRVQRLGEISEDDARAEGVEPVMWERKVYPSGRAATVETPSYRDGFGVLWDEINGKRCPWSSNPWVWAISFRRVQLP